MGIKNIFRNKATGDKPAPEEQGSVEVNHIPLRRGAWYIFRQGSNWFVNRVTDYDEVVVHTEFYNHISDHPPTVDEVKALTPFAGHTAESIKVLATWYDVELLFHEPLDNDDRAIQGYRSYLEGMGLSDDVATQQVSAIIAMSNNATVETAVVKTTNKDVATAEVILDVAETLNPVIKTTSHDHINANGILSVLSANYEIDKSIEDLTILYTAEDSVAEASPIIDVYVTDENNAKQCFSVVIRNNQFHFLSVSDRQYFNVFSAEKTKYQRLEVDEAESSSSYPLVKSVIRELLMNGYLDR